MGGPLSSLVEAPGLPFGPEDALSPEQRKHSAAMLGTGEGLPFLTPPFLRLTPYRVCSEFSVRELLETFLMS